MVALYQLLWPVRSSDEVVRSEEDQGETFRGEVTTYKVGERPAHASKV